MIMCVLLLPLTTVLKLSPVCETFCENCSHFKLKWFQPNSFEEVCFLEERYKNMQKIQILNILRAPSIQHQYAFKLKEKINPFNMYSIFEGCRNITWLIL